MSGTYWLSRMAECLVFGFNGGNCSCPRQTNSNFDSCFGIIKSRLLRRLKVIPGNIPDHGQCWPSPWAPTSNLSAYFVYVLCWTRRTHNLFRLRFRRCPCVCRAARERSPAGCQRLGDKLTARNMCLLPNECANNEEMEGVASAVPPQNPATPPRHACHKKT